MGDEPFDLEAVRRELAPSGAIRCALNHGNVVLVRRGATDESPSGISVELARELGRRLNLPIKFLHYDKAGAVTDAAGRDEWDICFLAIDPKRAEQLTYSEAYVQIEGAFLVRKEASINTPEDVVRLMPKMGAVAGSAYELHLTRTGRGGDLVRFNDFRAAVSALEKHRVDGLAGIRQAMQKVAASHPDVEVMVRPFMTIPQAMGVRINKPLAGHFIATFVREAKLSGFVRRMLDENGHREAVVPIA
ncbi:transporter substrate-binding domain-containing protein [Rhizobium rhizogenes]|uniref:transporter substrate-binding domain-containing protein n=1 Tax=Rhizobium rhizogenes TaxID=359 RepID=UPI001572812C|nr:transporter substrate-binding domain-containing protein [Rhizobium rhizogenes]NTF83955.1 transporter substrate-binding domain-containing protein [Rhizobium rhizogenes]